MAQRYSGPHSPRGGDAQRATPGAIKQMPARVDPVGARSNLLFLPPVILAFTSLADDAMGLAIGLAGAGALLLGAWLLRDGLRAQAAYDARSIARRPALPRKILAAALCGAGTALAVHDGAATLPDSVVYGAIATLLHLGAFGIDPLRDKRGTGVAGMQSDRVARVVDEAERYLADLHAAGRSTGDRQIEARIDAFAGSVRTMIRTVEDDPRDLTAARRYLGVYLMGARDAAQKFAALASRRETPAARADFLALLTDLESGFAKKTQTLLTDDAADLEIEMSVLSDRLNREAARYTDDPH